MRIICTCCAHAGVSCECCACVHAQHAHPDGLHAAPACGLGGRARSGAPQLSSRAFEGTAGSNARLPDRCWSRRARTRRSTTMARGSRPPRSLRTCRPAAPRVRSRERSRARERDRARENAARPRALRRARRARPAAARRRSGAAPRPAGRRAWPSPSPSPSHPANRAPPDQSRNRLGRRHARPARLPARRHAAPRLPGPPQHALGRRDGRAARAALPRGRRAGGGRAEGAGQP